MSDIYVIENFLTEVPVFYLTTMNGNQPKCRPIGFHCLMNDKIYFAVGTHKDVYQQMIQNPLVEICACKGAKFLHYFGKAVFEKNKAIEDHIFQKSPGLKKIYNNETGHELGIFYLENAKAEVHIMSKIKETYTF